MLFYLLLSFIGYIDTITNQGVLLEREGKLYPFVIKNFSVFANFSKIEDLGVGDKIKIDFIEKEAVPVVLKIEKLKKFQINPFYEIKESILKENLKKYTPIDVRKKEDFIKYHIPFSTNNTDNLKEPVLIYGEDSQDEKVIDLFLKLKLGGFEEVLVYSGGFYDWNIKGNFFYTEPEAIINYKEDFVLIDARTEKERGEGVIPFAYFKEIDKMNWEEFSSKDGMPPLVFYGNDEFDERPKIAAEKVLKWRYEGTKNGPVSILRGGVEELKGKGFKLNKIEIKEFKKNLLKKEGKISFEEIKNLNGIFFVDLRDEENPKANLQFPLNKIDEKLNQLPKDKKIILFCYEGKRSKIAYYILKKLNYDVKYLSEEINF